MSDYPTSTFKHPSSVVLFNLLDHLPFFNVKGRTILSLLENNDPFLDAALIDLYIFCFDDYTYKYLVDAGYSFSDIAKNKQVEKRKQYEVDTVNYNINYVSMPHIHFSNVKLYTPDYNMGFGVHAGKKVETVLKQSPAHIENMIQTLFWFGLTQNGINLMKDLEPGYTFLASTWDLLKRKFEQAPDYMKGIQTGYNIISNDNSDMEYESEYGGSWASEQEGFSDEDIDSAFDGDPDAYWNID